MATVRTWTKDTSLIEMDTNTYEKLEEILYMEEENKSKIIEDKKGYYIRYMDHGIINKIFCFTLSEVIIHLRYLKKIY